MAAERIRICCLLQAIFWSSIPVINESSLFRQQALERYTKEDIGSPYISGPFSYFAWVCFLTIVIVTIILFISFAKISITVTARGSISPIAGITKIYPP